MFETSVLMKLGVTVSWKYLNNSSSATWLTNHSTSLQSQVEFSYHLNEKIN